MRRELILTREERMLVQGVHAREQLLRPLVEELNSDRDYVVAAISQRLGVPVDRLSIDAPAGVVYKNEEI